MPKITDIPTFDAFMQPIIDRLKVHGRSMTIDEMVDDVSAAMGLTEEVRAVPHGVSGDTEVRYRMAWARTYLKKVGALDNSGRGIWTLTPTGAVMTPQDISAVRRQVQQMNAAGRMARDPGPREIGSDEDLIGTWRDHLLAVLGKMDPSAFERLCQRLLREAGFTKVEVTGKSGDGGIDGTGVLRMNLLSFQVIFQCKRWHGSVGSSVVRDFRGAMVGRADKGLIITTGAFTSEARKEATRDGAPAIDLVDGEALCDLLKEHRVGVKVEMVPQVTVDQAAIDAI